MIPSGENRRSHPTSSKVSQSLIYDSLAVRIVTELHLRVFVHLQSLSLRFHLERQTGSLNFAINRSVNAIQHVLNGILLNITPTLLELLLVAITLAKLYKVTYAFVIVITVAIYAIYTLRATKTWSEALRVTSEADDAINTIMTDALLNHEAIKSFSKEVHERRRFEEGYAQTRVASRRNLLIWSNLSLIQSLIVICSTTVTMLLAACDVLASRINVGDFVLINTYLLQLYGPLNVLGGFYLSSKRAFVDMEATLSLLEAQPDVADMPAAQPLNMASGEIEFDDVHFAFLSDRDILKGVSFRVGAGSRVAIVGATGAGKSTIAKLLARFYDVTPGRILIDGQDIRTVTQASLRAAIGVVPLDIALFNDTIFYNIA